MTTTQILSLSVAVGLPFLGTLAGIVQRNTTGKPQRIAAASAAILVDVLKFVDAVRGETHPDAILTPSPATLGEQMDRQEAKRDPDATLDPATTDKEIPK